ncbi:DUF1801 domain-containing protein [uncultured Planktosalinus sp.]|uniref:YdeI/OmpD-associated family protein n=1 Tax=uncultured Planktosalinus sp. TaxID=1810935 RepID=UPI0030D80E00
MVTDQVTAYIEKQTHWQEALSKLRSILKNTSLEETIKWGAPVYVAHGKNVLAIAGFKNYCCIWFYQGVFLKDSQKKLMNAQEGKTKALRQWRFESIDEIDETLILNYAEEAIANAKEGKEIKPIKSKEIKLPLELKEALEKNTALKQRFDTLTPYKQKEYKEHIGSAKQEKTRLNRLEKCIPLILKGIGLNDKYKNC